jgi:TRAP-type C4-dicarboxylate transport system permease small subunit
MKATERAWAIFDKTLTVLMVLAAVLVIFDTLAISVDVLLRYSIGSSWAGLFEISEYSLLWITFLSAAWILRIDGHIRVDLVLNRLNPKRRAITNIITSIVCVILFGVMIWYTIKVTLQDYQIGFNYPSVLRPPKWTIEIIIPIGYFLLFIQFSRIVYGRLKNWKALSTE